MKTYVFHIGFFDGTHSQIVVNNSGNIDAAWGEALNLSMSLGAIQGMQSLTLVRVQ